MKRLLVFVFAVALFVSCGKKGCTDPQAENYDSNFTKDDGTCLYSILGDWEMQTYILNGDDLTSTFSDYNIHFYSDNSYLCEFLLLGGTNYVNTRGTFAINDLHSEITFENTEINTNDGNGWTPEISSNSYSVNTLTNESLNMFLTSSSDPMFSSVEVILSKI